MLFEKQKYEKYVIECKKLRTFIKRVVERNITVPKKTMMSGSNMENY